MLSPREAREFTPMNSAIDLSALNDAVAYAETALKFAFIGVIRGEFISWVRLRRDSRRVVRFHLNVFFRPGTAQRFDECHARIEPQRGELNGRTLGREGGALGVDDFEE